MVDFSISAKIYGIQKTNNRGKCAAINTDETFNMTNCSDFLLAKYSN